MKNLDMFGPETWEEALEADIMACGGFKSVGAMLWKSLLVQEAGKKLRRVCNEEHRQTVNKLEEAAIIRLAAGFGSRKTLEFYARLGNAKVVPMAPEDSKAEVVERYQNIIAKVLPLLKQIEEEERAKGYTFDQDKQP